jgi:MFS family permease
MTEASHPSLASSPAALLTPANIRPSLLLIGGVALHASFTFIVPTVLPSAIPEIGGLSLYAWATTLFMVGSMIGSAATAALLTRFGLRGAFHIGLGVFAAGMLCGAVATSMTMIIIGRLLQGLGGGTMTAVAFAMVPTLFPSRLHPRAIAMVSGVWGPCALAGPLIGGVFADSAAWRMSFYVALLFSAAVAALATKALSNQRTDPNQTLAIPGWRLAIIAAAALSISVGGIRGSWVEAVLGLLVAAGCVVVVLRMDARAARPLLPGARFDLNQIGGAVLTTMFLLVFSLGAQPFLPYMLGVGYHIPLILAGPIAAASAISWTLGSVLSATLSKNGGTRVVLAAGPVISMVGAAATGYALVTGSIIGVAVSWALLGLGIGIAWPHLSSLLIAVATPRERQLASMSIAMIQLAGLAFGSAYAGLVANLAGFADAGTSAQLIHAGGWLFALCVLPAALAFFTTLRLIVLTARLPRTSKITLEENVPMNLLELTDRMRTRIATKAGFGATVKFDFGQNGVIHVDGLSSPYLISNDDKEADCVVNLTLDDFIKITKGELDGNVAFVTGKLRVVGNVSVAMNLSTVFS